ncbi:hypothetical protein, partial [Paenacidovorax caeni]|uniref:hypothetical protein n=1 Tax=Paenacidovorax caeni TaxID=343013 RepID=UPI001F1EDEE4
MPATSTAALRHAQQRTTQAARQPKVAHRLATSHGSAPGWIERTSAAALRHAQQRTAQAARQRPGHRIGNALPAWV